MKKGLVIKTTGSDYWVRLSDGSLLMCKAKGNFRIMGIKSTNPVVVGDFVTVDEFGYIIEIAPRRNYIVRKPTNLSKQLQIIAANLDQAMLIITIKSPQTALEFIDRFLVTAEAYRVPVILVFNKTDLLDSDDLAYLDKVIHLYQTIGYRCMKLSAIKNDGIDALSEVLQGKVTLLSGNSGVGKSTLTKTLIPQVEIKTAEISSYHHKGMHTTTFSEMHELPFGGGLIDTPGIKGFGVVDMKEQEIGHYFPEIFAISKQCRFANCTHRHEPDCAVLKALDDSFISQSRYLSYLSILEDVQSGKYR